MVAGHPPKSETTTTLAEVREAVREVEGGKTAGVCNTSAEMQEAGIEVMIHRLHAMWQLGAIPPN